MPCCCTEEGQTLVGVESSRRAFASNEDPATESDDDQVAAAARLQAILETYGKSNKELARQGIHAEEKDAPGHKAMAASLAVKSYSKSIGHESSQVAKMPSPKPSDEGRVDSSDESVAWILSCRSCIWMVKSKRDHHSHVHACL